MPYVLGNATVTIHPDGRREVTTGNLRVMPGDKPRTLEASGSDPEVWKRIRAGEVGTHEVVAHFGAATALLVPTGAIALPDEHFFGPMVAQSGELGPEALLGAVRTGASAATQHCVDTCGGMFTTLDCEREALASMLKILVFKHDGWVRLVLPVDLAAHQAAFDNAQRERWAVAREGFSPAHEAELEFVPVGQDRCDGKSTLVVFGPIGDCQFIRAARIALQGADNRFRDGEWRLAKTYTPTGEQEMEPLHRKVVAITTVENHPGVPLVLELGDDGCVRDGGLHFLIEGPLNRDKVLSRNPRRVLGPHGLGWLIT